MPVIKSVPWVQLYVNGDGTLKVPRLRKICHLIQKLGTVDDHVDIIHKPVFPFKVRLKMNILLHVNHKS